MIKIRVFLAVALSLWCTLVQAQYFDAETGLHYNGARYYDPKAGRYISSDPIGLAGGLNTYTYGYNNPLKYIDPDGQNPLIVQGILRLLQIGLGVLTIATDDVPMLGGGAASKVCKVSKGADTIADGLRISPYRVTGPGETFIRYESGNPAFTRITPGGGVTPGTFAAPSSDGIVPLANRAPVYNLPNPQIPRPNVITLTPRPGTPIIGPRPVVGGTGNEVIFPMGY